MNCVYEIIMINTIVKKHQNSKISIGILYIFYGSYKIYKYIII